MSCTQSDGEEIERIGQLNDTTITQTDVRVLRRIAGVGEFGYLIPSDMGEAEYLFQLALLRVAERVAAKLTTP